jgi:hypothetical protein
VISTLPEKLPEDLSVLAAAASAPPKQPDEDFGFDFDFDFDFKSAFGIKDSSLAVGYRKVMNEDEGPSALPESTTLECRECIQADSSFVLFAVC